MTFANWLIPSFEHGTDRFLTLFNSTPKFNNISQLYSISNHPIWLIGHLAYSFDRACSAVGGEKLLTDKWIKLFGARSRPMPIRTEYPQIEELVNQFTICKNVLSDMVIKLPPQRFSKDSPEFCRDVLPTVGDFLVYYMVGHVQYHIGQLSTFRAVHQVDRIPDRLDVKTDDVETEPSISFICQHCNRKFTKKFALSNHINSAHPNAK